MKKIFVLFIALILNCNEVFASENFLNKNWWKTATVEDVEAEIANGADVNAKTESGEIKGLTVLMLASGENKNPEVIKILIDAGADVNAKIESGEAKDGTALMSAIFENKNPEVIKALIDAGADVNAYSTVEGGGTALIFAAQDSKNSEVIKMLIDAGADVNAKDTYGHTALYYARLFEKQEIMEFLQAYQSNFNEFDEMFAECYSIQNIGSYANKFCECAIKTAIKALGVEDQQKAQEAFENARAGTFKNLIQKGKSAAFNECY